MKQPALVNRVLRTVPDLDAAIDQLGDPTDAALANLIESPPRQAAIIGVRIDELPAQLQDPGRESRQQVVKAARQAAVKIRQDGSEADLTPEEVTGAEAIIIFEGRPAILIQDGRFFPPPTRWQSLEDNRIEIEKVFPSVGRIEVTGHPRYEWVGTGWLGGEAIVITNRHVVKEFARPAGNSWRFESGMTARIDFGEEFGGGTPREFPITDVIAVHEDIDLALLKVTKVSGQELPSPLPITTRPEAPKKRQSVYVVGYPAADPGRNDPDVMSRIFSNIFNVKRLQPGEVIANKQALHSHDCSTLGGNSGSCVLNLETNQVIGLHFQGRYLEANWAVTMAKLRSDPGIRKAGLNFV